MADLPQQDTINQYVADGATDTFLVAYYVPFSDDPEPDTPAIDVYVTPAGQTPIPDSDIQEFGVAYTYTPNTNPITGGYITFTTDYIPATNDIVTISRDVPAALNVEFAQAQNFSGVNLDDALDTLLLIEQQNKTYALQRNLSYKVNSYLPAAQLSANTQLDILQPGYIWIGATGGGVVAAELQQGADTSTLRSELADENPVTNGAALVGYYDVNTSNPTTVAAQLSEFGVRTGMMFDFAGTTAPDDYLLCDGSAVSRTTYARLFAVIDTTWGVGDGTTTFNLPDFRRNVAVGAGGSGSATLGNAVGDTGGAESYVLVNNDLPPHTHTHPTEGSYVTNGVANNAYQASGGNVQGQISSTSGLNTTTNQAVSLMQPSAVVLKIIKT